MINDVYIDTTLPKLYLDLQLLLKTIHAVTTYKAKDNNEYIPDYFNNEIEYVHMNSVYQFSFSQFEEESLSMKKNKMISKFEVTNYMNVKTNCFTSKLSVK